jgi:probable phosphoglycerate mutase
LTNTTAKLTGAGDQVCLYVVRHGQTEWSLSGQHTGRTDIPLTGQGEGEARELRPWLGHVDFAHVFTSPMQRARSTCALAGLGDRAEVEPDLSEWDYGDYEGIRSADIRKQRPGWNVFRDGCPNGEMPGEVAARADRLISKLCAIGGNVALFSHGQFSLVLATRWIGIDVVQARHFLLHTASISILRFDPAHPEVRAIGLWNATPAMLPHGV